MSRLGRALALLGMVVAVVLPNGGATAAATPDDWPSFGHDPGHSGVSGETTISTANAGNLGIKWQVNTGDAVTASPVVAFNAQLGKRVVYVGNNAGVMSAYDAATGRRIWFKQAGPRINSTATVVNGIVYVGSADKKLYAFDGATGAVRCTRAIGGVIASSPVAVNPDGTGLVIYFGDNGLNGFDDGGHLWAVNGIDPNAAANCSVKWSFNGYGATPGSQPGAGTWSPPAFAKDRNGRPLVIFGGSSPDDAVYALDARTGARVWRFQANPTGKFDADVGAGPTVSAPGNNGIADGVVYVSGKENVTYALNLRTGAKQWAFDIAADSPGVEGYARSTAALNKTLLYVGYGAGVYQLNAVTGAKLWKTPPTAEVISSPALSGPDNQRVLAVGDLAGKVHVFNAGSGARVWSYPTGGQIYSSPAVSNGTIFIGSTDGFLYAFAPGGAGGGAPSTTVTAPVNGSTVPNPDGNLALRGTATDNTESHPGALLGAQRQRPHLVGRDVTHVEEGLRPEHGRPRRRYHQPDLVRLVPRALRRRELHRARRGRRPRRPARPHPGEQHPVHREPRPAAEHHHHRSDGGRGHHLPGRHPPAVPRDGAGHGHRPGRHDSRHQGGARHHPEPRARRVLLRTAGVQLVRHQPVDHRGRAPEGHPRVTRGQHHDVEHLGADVRPSAQLHGHGLGDRRERPRRAVPPDPHVLRA